MAEEKVKNKERQYRQEGPCKYYKCNTCGDYSVFEDGIGQPFCINQHKNCSGAETQPVSLGANMNGVAWEKTPEGKKKR